MLYEPQFAGTPLMVAMTIFGNGRLRKRKGPKGKQKERKGKRSKTLVERKRMKAMTTWVNMMMMLMKITWNRSKTNYEWNLEESCPKLAGLRVHASGEPLHIVGHHCLTWRTVPKQSHLAESRFCTAVVEGCIAGHSVMYSENLGSFQPNYRWCFGHGREGGGGRVARKPPAVVQACDKMSSRRHFARCSAVNTDTQAKSRKS